jgi:hypothetical protein
MDTVSAPVVVQVRSEELPLVIIVEETKKLMMAGKSSLAVVVLATEEVAELSPNVSYAETV